MKKKLLPTLVLFNLFLFTSTVKAEQSYFQQTMGVNLGYFFTDINNKVELSGSIEGTNLDFSTDLGMNDHINTFKTDIFWRINPKHRIDFTWFGLFQSGQQLTEKDILIEDTLIPAGTGLTSSFNHNRYQLTYTYNLFQGDNYEIGPSLGIYTLSINSRIDPTVANASVTTYSNTDLALPLPVVGLRGSYGITDNLVLHSNFNFMVVDFNEWNGDLYDFQLAAEYNFLKYMGIGLAYNLSFLTVNHRGDGSLFRYNYDYQGVQTYLKFAF